MPRAFNNNTESREERGGRAWPSQDAVPRDGGSSVLVFVEGCINVRQELRD